jgi:hypothetical protein
VTGLTACKISCARRKDNAYEELWDV